MTTPTITLALDMSTCSVIGAAIAATVIEQGIKYDTSPADPDRWLNSREAREYLGLTTAALDKLAASRRIPFEQDCPGGKRWFKRSELDAWRRGILPASET